MFYQFKVTDQKTQAWEKLAPILRKDVGNINPKDPDNN